jgi:hypothetical protein
MTCGFDMTDFDMVVVPEIGAWHKILISLKHTVLFEIVFDMVFIEIQRSIGIGCICAVTCIV